jgi:hypothetical protein
MAFNPRHLCKMAMGDVETSKSEDAHKALDEIMRKIGKLADRRNDLIHHAWATDAQGKRPHRFGIDIRENPSPEHENQLSDLFERIDGVTRELIRESRQDFFVRSDLSMASRWRIKDTDVRWICSRQWLGWWRPLGFR